MSHFEFVIPVRKDDLLESHFGQYHVEDVVPPRLMMSKLQDAARGYNADGLDYILEHFNTYFSVMLHGTTLEWNLINKGFDHMDRTVKSLCNHLEMILQDNEIENELRVKNLNIVKMTMYLFTGIMKVRDAKLASDNSSKLTLGKKGKKAGNDNEFCGWTEADKQAALLTIHLLIQQPISKLWDPPLAEEDFVSTVAEPCYKAIEEPIIRTKTARETVFQILGVLIKKYNHGNSAVIKLVQVLQSSEHAISAICGGVVQLTRDFNLTTFGPQMVREIAETLANSADSENAAGTEMAATRNCASFLLELTKEMPKEMTCAVATIQSYLETDEAYNLRISVLGMMCEVLCAELTGEHLTEEQRAQRDDFLDDMLEHIHDVSAYVRAKVLQYWAKLQKENCIPLVRQSQVMERTLGRLRDRSAIVRKAAIQLMRVFLECNPFAAELKIEDLEMQLAEESKTLDQLKHKLDPTPDEKLIKEWDGIEQDVVKMIKENIDTATQDEPDLSQASLDNLYDAIKKHLSEGNYHKAYLIIKHTERMYPDAKFLRSTMEKSDQIAYFVALLRNVYIIPECVETISQQCNNELALHRAIEEKEAIVVFLTEKMNFVKLMTEAVPLINNLLRSKQSGDIHEAIEFFTTAHLFNIEAAKRGVADMLALVWSPDQEKREAVEKAYRDMYIEGAGGGTAERARAYGIARSLATLAGALSRGHGMALERLVATWVERGDVSPAVIQVFWEMFLKKIDGTTDLDSYAALSLLVMIAKAKPSVTLANLEVIQNHGLTGDYNSRFLSAQLLLALEKKKQRYPEDHPVFKSLFDSLLEAYSEMTKFASFAAVAIDFLYAVCDSPESFCQKLLRATYEKLRDDSTIADDDMRSYATELLTRFVFLLGHVALNQLIYLDVSVYSELRRRNQIREDRKLAEKRKKKAEAAATPGRARKTRLEELRRDTNMNCSSASASSRSARPGSTNTTMTEDGSGLEGAVADDADAEYVRNVCERDIVGRGCALNSYLPLLRHILSNPTKFPATLQTATALTLTRFMLVSSEVCEDGLQLMITVLTKSKHEPLRTNLTIAFADLTLRFPNLTQPWTQHMYHILNDAELEVRRCAIKMLSFLVLHEMIRVKGQIADMALCCADQDARVSDMTRWFFKQLSQKGNSLYNVMPDIISRLSDPELAVPEDKYRAIMKYITSLIQKDRQMEALVEKLCQRFKLSTEERQWRDLAYCLSLFTYNERSLRKLIDHMDCYKDKLHSRGVSDCFNALMNAASKNAKNEVKAIVQELSDKIQECFSVGEEEGGAGSGAEGVLRERQERTPRATPRKRAPRRHRKSSSDEENEPQNEIDAATPTRRSSRRQARNQVSMEVDSDDSDEEINKKEDEVFKKPVNRRPLRKKK